MQFLDFSEVVKLLNHSRTTQIQAEPIKAGEAKWRLYQGVHRVHTAEYRFKILYLYASVSNYDIRVAAREIAATEDNHIVYPPSLERQIKGSADIQGVFGKANLWTIREYLLSYIKDEIQIYLSKLSTQKPKDYIHPRFDTPSGFPRRRPNPILSYLQDPETEADFGKLGILLAEPGQGKTYMSRYLVGSMAEAGTGLVPLMVDSSQWHAMPVEDQRSLLKTIVHSFKHFGAAIGWLEGHEDEFLRVTLKADIFRIVFDGFDEYILRNAGAVQPIDVLEALADLAETTGARIVLTSRTSFWHTNLPEVEVDKFLEKHGAHIYRILPFDLQYAKNYFEQRLKTQAKVEQAVQTYSLLSKEDEDFVGRGFILSLVADLAEQGGQYDTKPVETSQVMHWLIEALCERERLRQQLPFSALEQISMLRTFSVEVAEGSNPSTELLEMAMGIARTTLDPKSRELAIDKLKSHPLIEKQRDADLWRFKQEQVRILLLAEEIADGSSLRAQRFISKARLDPETWQDVATMIVDIMRRTLLQGEIVRRLQKLIGSISLVRGEGSEPAGSSEGERLAGMVALTAVERFFPRGSSHQDRTKFLVKLCGETAIRGITFTGTVARYDFSGAKFERCRFERVAWANCTFDDQTIFEYCQFIGGVPPEQCTGMGNVQFLGTVLDPEAEALFNSERIREGKRKYSTDDLRADVHAVITKFIIKGGIGIRSVEARNLQKGPIGASRYRREILDVLRSTVLEDHHISGPGAGYNIRKDAVEAVKFYAANNVFTGPLREAFERLQKKLSLE